MRRTSALLVLSLVYACSGDDTTFGPGDGGSDATIDSSADASGVDAAHVDGSAMDATSDAPTDAHFDVTPVDGSITHPCSLPGSIQYTANGVVVVPGGMTPPVDLGFLKVPTGFCVHYFAHVGNARQVRFAPGGELFVASPTTGTTGGGSGGRAAIVVLTDDDKDGVADPATPNFLTGLPSTQGLLFTPGFFYYQDGIKIMKVPYASGDRAPSGASAQVAAITVYQSGLHWPKTLDVADDGTIYVGNGGDQGEVCDPIHPFHGGILKLDGTDGGAPVAKGLRNPIAVRCARGHNQCFAVELAKDYTANLSGREKLLPIRQGDDWGFPCCASRNLPYQDVFPVPDCSTVTADTNSFLIGDTPFGVDFEPGFWPAAWQGHAFVTTHGTAGPWLGARVVGIPMDPNTGLPTPSTNINGMNVGMADFATGWDDGTQMHGRPSALTFSNDGRMFLANDNSGVIVWIAPIAL